MIIVLSAGGSASVLGSGRDDARAKDAPRNGAAGVDSRSGGVAHAPLREASVAISRRSRTTEAARARATASTLRRGASRAEVTKGRVSLAPSFHHGEAAVSGQTGPFFSRRKLTQPPLTRTISAARESAESPAPSTPVPPSRPGTRCGRRRRRPRLEARAPFRALVSLEETDARPRAPDPARFARRCDGCEARTRRRDGAGAPPRTTRLRWSTPPSWTRSQARRPWRRSIRPSRTSTRPRACGTSPRSSTRPPRRRSRRAARGFALQRR